MRAEAILSRKGVTMAAYRDETFTPIRAGLWTSRERKAAIERWLREEVVPVAEAILADPGRTISAERVFGEIRDLHRRREGD